MGRISIQVSVPPQRALSPDIQSIALMNRSMTQAFTNVNQDTLESHFVRKKLALDEIMLDSLAADTTLKTLGKALFASGRFDIVIPVRRNLPNSNVSYLEKSPSLTQLQVKQICSEFNVDALLVLENFHEKVNTAFHLGYFDKELVGFSKNYTAFVQVAYHSNWKLYQPLEKLMVAKFEVNDTIYWERNGETLQEAYENLPAIKDALLDGAIENGDNLAAFVTPGWKSENRKYFVTNNPEADKALVAMNDDNWREAENIWLKYSTSSSASFRSKIEFNLALASEMNGNLNEALQWAQKSLQSKYSKMAEDYIRLLNDRLVNK